MSSEGEGDVLNTDCSGQKRAQEFEVPKIQFVVLFKGQ